MNACLPGDHGGVFLPTSQPVSLVPDLIPGSTVTLRLRCHGARPSAASVPISVLPTISQAGLYWQGNASCSQSIAGTLAVPKVQKPDNVLNIKSWAQMSRMALGEWHGYCPLCVRHGMCSHAKLATVSFGPCTLFLLP